MTIRILSDILFFPSFGGGSGAYMFLEQGTLFAGELDSYNSSIKKGFL